MKIFVASDIHGSAYFMKKFAKLIEKDQPDQIILLGDLYYHGPRNKFPKGYNPKETASILNLYKSKIKCVKGNCDAEVDQMISSFEIQDSFETEISGKSFLFVHGQNLDTGNMPKKDFTFGGHTHCYVIIEYNGITTYVNPGSLGLPKNSKFPTFAVIEDNKITIRKLDNTVLETKEF